MDGFKTKEEEEFCCSRTSLKDYMSGKTKSKKMDRAPILMKKLVEGLFHYLEEMVNLDILKAKIGEMTQIRFFVINFYYGRNGLGTLTLIDLMQPQFLKSKKICTIYSSNVQRF